MDNFVPATETLDPQPRRNRTLRRLLIFVIAAVCVVVISLIVIRLVFPSTDQPAQTETATLAEQTILANLEQADIETPDLSSYSYIDTSDLIGPSFDNITIGDAYIDGATQQTYRVINATATYHNASLLASIELLQRFFYDDDTDTWTPGEISQGSLEVTPQRAIETSAIKEALPTLLQKYDRNLAEQFDDSEYLLTPMLTADGGTVKVVMSKTEGGQQLTCDVDLVVEWDQNSGWKITISSVGEVEESKVGENTDSKDNGFGNISELTGTIEMRDGVVLLRTDNDIQIDANYTFETDDEAEGDIEDTGTQNTWTTDLFELIDTSDDFTSGMRVTVEGAITMSGTLEDVPFAITVTDITNS